MIVRLLTCVGPISWYSLDYLRRLLFLSGLFTVLYSLSEYSGVFPVFRALLLLPSHFAAILAVGVALFFAPPLGSLRHPVFRFRLSCARGLHLAFSLFWYSCPLTYPSPPMIVHCLSQRLFHSINPLS